MGQGFAGWVEKAGELRFPFLESVVEFSLLLVVGGVGFGVLIEMVGNVPRDEGQSARFVKVLAQEGRPGRSACWIRNPLLAGLAFVAVDALDAHAVDFARFSKVGMDDT
ncbi:hypothetical protein V6Z98_007174 [Aspergillus fumigatus]|jgi:hypothetical protein